MKLCIDCKHYAADDMGVMYDKCHHPLAGKTDENNGIREILPVRYYLCSSMRLGLGCEGAKLWEAK
jgi:hypothetical protein